MVNPISQSSSFNLIREIQTVWKSVLCKIWEVDDWDTLNLDCWEEYFADVRMLWMNAADKDQDETWYEHCYYKEAKNVLKSVKNREIEVSFYWSDLCKDPYKWCRNVVRITDKQTSLDVWEIMISGGFAFSWTQFSSIPSDLKLNYMKAEKKATKSNIWLWKNCKVDYLGSTSMDSWQPNQMTR